MLLANIDLMCSVSPNLIKGFSKSLFGFVIDYVIWSIRVCLESAGPLDLYMGSINEVKRDIPMMLCIWMTVGYLAKTSRRQ